MAPFAINSSGAGTNTIYTGYGAQSLSLATKAALDAVTLTDIQGFYSLLDFPRQAL